MSTPTTVRVENKTQGEVVKALCLSCNAETRHLVLQSIDCDGKEFVEDSFWLVWRDDYQIIQCQGCETIGFRHEHFYSEDVQEGFNGTTTKVYPSKPKNFRSTKDYYNVPLNLRRIYRETIDAYNVECYTLSAAGLRALVEGICSENGVLDGQIEVTRKDGTKTFEVKNNLQAKISGLHQKKLLTEQQASILHSHRSLGNNALHELKMPSVSDLGLAIDILEHILESLYEIPDKAEILQRKRTSPF